MATATKKKPSKQKHNVDLSTGVGIISFPHVFKETVATKKDGSLSYETQFLIPKSDKATVRALLKAIKEVGEAEWGDRWKSVRSPLRDADKEADDMTDDGQTKGEKYPERLGHYFINARSKKPVSVVDRDRSPITDADEIYGGVRAKIHVSLYPYSQEGNHGIGVALNGVQKVRDGEPFGGGGKPAVESMFDELGDEDDDDLGGSDFDDEVEEQPKAKAKGKDKGKKKKKSKS